MLRQVRELIKSGEFSQLVQEYKIDYCKVHQDLSAIEDFILHGTLTKKLKTNKVKYLIEKVLNAFVDKNPYSTEFSQEYDVDWGEQSTVLTKNKTDLNCHKEIVETREPINIDTIFEFIHRRFKYPNETLKKTLGFFATQTPYKDCEDYAQDFILNLLQRQNSILYDNLDEGTLLKLTNNALRNYIISVTKSFAKDMIPEPQWGLSCEEWELVYLVGTNRRLNHSHTSNTGMSQKSQAILSSLGDKWNIPLLNRMPLTEIRIAIKSKFDEMGGLRYAPKKG